ncbi:MAG: PqqD family protein [Nitrospiraceae bacterium]|nr:MAG: PqqD family protein [Nitrospiraceae bacterium]
MDLNSMYPDRSPQTASRVIDNEAVIISPQENKVMVLNGTGSRIWELLNGDLRTDRIALVISEEFDVSYDDALNDTREFINDLYARDMLIYLEHPKEEALT